MTVIKVAVFNLKSKAICNFIIFINYSFNINPRLCQIACRAEGVRWEAASCPAPGFRSGGQHSGRGSIHQKPPRTGPAVWTGLYNAYKSTFTVVCLCSTYNLLFCLIKFFKLNEFSSGNCTCLLFLGVRWSKSSLKKFWSLHSAEIFSFVIWLMCYSSLKMYLF